MKSYKEDSRPQYRWWAPGSYFCKCFSCGNHFIGDKRSIMCADCAYGQTVRAKVENDSVPARSYVLLETTGLMSTIRRHTRMNDDGSIEEFGRDFMDGGGMTWPLISEVITLNESTPHISFD